jgi:hypothetical protein
LPLPAGADRFCRKPAIFACRIADADDMPAFRSSRRRRPSWHSLPTVARCAVVGLLAAGLLSSHLPAVGAGVADLPPLVRTKQRTLSVPFRLPASQDPDPEAAPRRVELHVSRDLGGSWTKVTETSPATGSLSFTADVDGEYWLRLRAIDGRGRGRGNAGPDMRVLVDAAGPRLVARVWKGADGEIACRFAAVDDSIDLASLRVEYRTDAAGGWKQVSAEGILARQAPAHLVGEEIWWAGEKVDSLTVRITVADESGNRTVQQFDMEPADPRVDQTALAHELGVPPLPMQQAATMESVTSSQTADGFAADTFSARPDFTASANPAWQPESARWGAPVAAAPRDAGLPGHPDTAQHRSVLVRSPPADNQTENYRTENYDVPAPDASTPTSIRGLPAGFPGHAPPFPATGPTESLQHQGLPLHASRSRRFAWGYQAVTASDGAVQPLRAELWSTRDGSITWQRTAVDDSGSGRFEVFLPEPGLYGVRLELFPVDRRADAPLTGPRSGDPPDGWVMIDEDAPEVQLDVELVPAATDPSRPDGTGPALRIRYHSRDLLPAARGGRLLYSPHPAGPWVTIAADLEASGEYRWEPDRGVPARVYLRAEVVDAAGNVGAATSGQPIPISTGRIEGRLGGLTPLPVPETP